MGIGIIDGDLITARTAYTADIDVTRACDRPCFTIGERSGNHWPVRIAIHKSHRHFRARQKRKAYTVIFAHLLACHTHPAGGIAAIAPGNVKGKKQFIASIFIKFYARTAPGPVHKGPDHAGNTGARSLTGWSVGNI